MSPQRVAAAATVSPYPFDVRQGHQAQASTTTEDADRGPHIKGKKPKPKPRAERNPRQEEEIRFNTGPRNLRMPQASRGGRRVFRMPGRVYPEDQNGVPDYPPPSFQEAMTTPPVSVCSSTTSLPLAPTTVPLIIPENIPENISEDPRESMDPPAVQSIAEVPASDNDLDFEGTMFVIDRNSVPFCSTDLPKGMALEERVKSDWIKRRGVEFPGKAPVDPMSSNKSTDKIDVPNRGRPSTRQLTPLLIDPDPKNDIVGLSSPINSPKRRFLSLSPLRTIFPPRSPTQQDRATLSAHPSPSPSPYHSSRSLFFRSSTSLATASFLKLPLLSSPIASKSELLSRKIFKGKDRSKTIRDPETIETWEVLSEEAYAGVDEDGKESAEHPRSLLSAVESIQPRVADETSPTRSQSFTFGTQITSPSRGKRPLVAPEATDEERHSLGLPRTVQENSLRDWKGPSTAFIDRPLYRSRSPTPGVSEISVNTTHIVNSISPSPSESMPAMLSGPPLTAVRVRAASPSPSPSPPPSLGVKHTAHVAHPSPLRVDAKPNIMVSQLATEANMYQRALDTPLPTTPVFYSYFDKGGSVGSLDLEENGDLGATPFSVRTLPIKLTNPISAHELKPFATTLSIAIHSSATLAAPTLVVKTDSSEEPMTPTRHHYAGRPLPRPPPNASRVGVVDSLYASPESPIPSGEKNGSSYNNCPEGLLIDLDDTTLDDFPGSGASTPADSGRFNSQLHLPIPLSQASSSSVDLLTDPPSFAYNSIQRTSTPLLPTSPSSGHSVPQSNALSEFTDLDVLVSRLADDEHDGSDYDTLLLVSELIGPANPAPTNTSPKVNPNGNMSLIGRIEVKRRRTTKEGVVKLKLTLLDVSVNKCGICLSQFKDEDMAALTSICQHSFHEKCLERWLARSKTCPLCRIPLDTDVR